MFAEYQGHARPLISFAHHLTTVLRNANLQTYFDYDLDVDGDEDSRTGLVVKKSQLRRLIKTL